VEGAAGAARQYLGRLDNWLESVCQLSVASCQLPVHKPAAFELVTVNWKLTARSFTAVHGRLRAAIEDQHVLTREARVDRREHEPLVFDFQFRLGNSHLV
jgi:hypothetical protein